MKIRPVGIELFHGDGQMDKYKEAKSLFGYLRTRLENLSVNVVLGNNRCLF